MSGENGERFCDNLIIKTLRVSITGTIIIDKAIALEP